MQNAEQIGPKVTYLRLSLILDLYQTKFKLIITDIIKKPRYKFPQGRDQEASAICKVSGVITHRKQAHLF